MIEAMLRTARKKELVGSAGDVSMIRLHPHRRQLLVDGALSTSSTGLAAMVCRARRILGMKSRAGD